MGLLEKPKKAMKSVSTPGAVVKILSRYPDRMVIDDPELASLLGSEVKDAGAIGFPWIPLNRLWRVEGALRSWNWDKGLPKWIENGIRDSKAASDAKWASERIGWSIGEYAYIQAPYTLTLADRLTPPAISSPYFYSSVLEAWVISKIENDAVEIQQIVTDYDITVTPALALKLDGRQDNTSTLATAMKRAVKAGIKVPKKFASGRVLKPHQEVAVTVLAHRGQGQLADQVGLGKGGEFTCGLLALNRYLGKQDEELALPAFFSVTKSMKGEIIEEILKWDDTAVIHEITGTRIDELPDADYYVLNHDILAPRLPDILEKNPKAFVADEAHAFKNPDAKRTQAAQELADACRENSNNSYIVMATGTPFLSSPTELWSLLGILGVQDIFGEYALARVPDDTMFIKTRTGIRKVPISQRRAYEMRWCGGYYDKYRTWNANSATNTAELNRLLIEHTMIRRKKSDVMNPVPPLREQMIFMETTPEQFARYEEISADFKRWLIAVAREEAYEEDLSPEKAVEVALRKYENAGKVMEMTALRQELGMIKIHGAVEWIKGFMDGTQIVEHLDGHMGPVSEDPTRRKLIVYVHHKEPRAALLQHPALQQYGIRHILPGDEQSSEEIQQHKRDFQEDNDDARIIICTMAAREGHTLTAAKDVYIHEIPFVPSWIVQMAGRCWARFSEAYDPHEAWVHYAIARGTLDPSLVRKNKLKKAMFDAVIDGEGQDSDVTEMQEIDAAVLMEALEIGARELEIAR